MQTEEQSYYEQDRFCIFTNHTHQRCIWIYSSYKDHFSFFNHLKPGATDLVQSQLFVMGLVLEFLSVKKLNFCHLPIKVNHAYWPPYFYLDARSIKR